MKRRLSGLAVISTLSHSLLSSEAAARTGAATVIESAANTDTSSGGSCGRATARAAAARSCSSTLSLSPRMSVSACCAVDEDRSGERASSSTSWRQRTARSCALPAGCARTVLRRSSNRTRSIVSFTFTVFRSRGARLHGRGLLLTIPHWDSVYILFTKSIPGKPSRVRVRARGGVGVHLGLVRTHMGVAPFAANAAHASQYPD